MTESKAASAKHPLILDVVENADKPAALREGLATFLKEFEANADLSNVRDVLTKSRKVLADELFNVSLPFWLKNSLDTKDGGFFNCLDDKGKVYDTTKHMWMHCRQVWMFSKLALSCKEIRADADKHKQVLAAAKHGAEFLKKHARNHDHTRVYFSLARDGKPTGLQRKIFSECFFVMACVTYAHASGEKEYRQIGLSMFNHILKYIREGPASLGRPVLAGNGEASALNVPMITLNMIDEIRQATDKSEDAKSLFQAEAEWCIKDILKHVHKDKKMVFETVAADGSMLDSPEGRLLNPGHVIEAGWFLMAWIERWGPAPNTDKFKELQTLAIDIISWSFETGWDPKYQGLLYFLDASGASPTQLEWSMKLWWPANEALIALLMSHRAQPKETAHLKRFIATLCYSLRHFASPDGSSCWYGYCDREGRKTHNFVGGAYKCWFHVPRSLLFSMQTIDNILADMDRDAAGSKSSA